MNRDSFIKADLWKLQEIVREAESRLAAQTQIAIAADQRALALASLLVTLDAALIAFAATETLVGAGAIAVKVMIVGLMGAAGCSLWAALPIAWDLPGNTPAQWVADIADVNDDEPTCLADMAAHYAEMIADNSARMVTSANWFLVSLVIAFVSLATGGLLALAG